MKKKVFISLAESVFVLAAGLTLFLFANSSFTSQPQKLKEEGWSKEGVTKVVEANNRFAFDLYTVIKENEKGNLFYSPYSIFAALVMTYEGAKARTAEEIRAVFHFPKEEILRPNFSKVYNDLNQSDKSYQLKIANAIWLQQNHPFLKDYVNRIERYYGAKVTNVDFIKETEKTRKKINQYIEEQTNKKIKESISPGILDPLTKLVITNAIYFKGSWLWQFDPKLTVPMDFKITPTTSVKVPMMTMKPKNTEFNYADLDELQILELPYQGDKISMLILLPKEDLKKIEPLTEEKLKQWKNEMQRTKLDGIYLPKFEFTSKYLLNEPLKRLGMKQSFTPAADFSGMTGNRDLLINFVIHQAYIKVDEEGTEAAAATAVGIGITAYRPEKIFLVNHPFLFIIQEKETGNILFFGRIVDPSK